MPIPAGAVVAHATLNDLRKQLNRTDNRDDAELQLYLDAATEVVENILEGPVQVTTYTERHRASPTGVIVPFKQPLVSVTSVTPAAGGPALDSGSYTPSTELGMVTLAYGGRGDYVLVYEAGYASLPRAYKLATLIIAQHLWQTQNGGGGRVIPGDDLVQVAGASFAIPSRARDLLAGGPVLGIA